MKLALAGDTMLGRGVADTLRHTRPTDLFASEVVELCRSADLFVLNLECCISERGERWPAGGKPYFFRAPPKAVEVLQHLGVDAVTLANNHALDYGYDALADTLDLLDDAGIAHAGAGPDVGAARLPVVLEAAGQRVSLVALADHPADFAATEERAGIAHADVGKGVPEWVTEAIAASDADLVLVSPHWGPNMTAGPLPYVRDAARELVAAGAGLVAGHSAHVWHGIERIAESTVLYDLGDFIDDYAVEPVLRNDLGLLWLVTVEAGRATALEAVPLGLDYCHTRPARGEERDWIVRRFLRACADLGTEAREADGRVVADLSDSADLG